MSGPKVIWYQLANHAPLIAQVPAGRIKSGTLAVNIPLPAISISEISIVDRNTVSMSEPVRLLTSRVQVAVFAKTYTAAKGIIELVRKACPNVSGTVNGVTVDSVLPDGAGPDDDDEASSIYMQTRDFIVKYRVS